MDIENQILSNTEYIITSFDWYWSKAISMEALNQYWQILKKEHTLVCRLIEQRCPDSTIFSPMQSLVDTLKGTQERPNLFTLLGMDVVSFIDGILNADEIAAVSRNNEALATVTGYVELVKYSYIAGVAICRSKHPMDLFVLCDNFTELIIGIKYHSLFQEEFGKINLLHYMPLVTVHNKDMNTILYHCDMEESYHLHPPI